MLIRNKKYILLFLILLIYCITPSPYWIKNSEFSKDYNNQFIFFIEPGSSIENINKIVEEIFIFIDTLKSYPFLTIENTTYQIVIYKDYESYKYYRPFKIDSFAHFDRKEKKIHIPLTIEIGNKKILHTPSFVYFHEIIHAFLEECCKEYPIWINEGLALLLQNIEKKYNCEENSIMIPEYLIKHKNLYLQNRIHLPYYPDFEKLYNIYDQNLISGLFVYYLFNTRNLINYIQIIKNKENIYLKITKGNLDFYSKEREEFYNWLSNIKENQYLRGC